MKKTILFRHIFLTVFMLLFSFFLVSCGNTSKNVVIQDRKEDGDFKLIKINNKWYIGGLVNEGKEEIVIPSTLDIYGIWEKAFCDWKEERTNWVTNEATVVDYYNRTLKKVTIEKKLKRIDKEAFYGCRKLEKIDLPDSITELCDKSFYKCESLEKIIIPQNVTTIGREVFSWCRCNIVILGNVKKISIYAFGNTQIFFKGSISDWDNIKFLKHGVLDSVADTYVNNINKLVAFYSEEKPIDYLNNYWHYVSDEPVLWN